MKKILAAAIATLTVALCVYSEDTTGGAIQVGVRPGLTLADGEPANDILSLGIFGRYSLNSDWLIGLALDFAGYDFEQPAKAIGLVPASIVDATATEYIISLWLEREFDMQISWLSLFLGAGLGLGIVNTDDVTGQLSGGGTYDITTDPGLEVIPSVLAGLRASLGASVFAEFAIHADYRFTTWDIRDRVSGLTGSLDDYFTYGGYAAIGWKF